MAGGIAHDFNNALMIINSYAEMILNLNTLDPVLRRYIEQIMHAGQTAASLGSQLLALSGNQLLPRCEPGRDTTVNIYLPFVAGSPATAPPPEGHKEATGRDHQTVLLVDDDAGLCSAAREFLERKGYRVLVAEDGPGALGVCAAHREAIHALITDLVLPGIRGGALAGMVRNLYPQIKVIYMSGYSDAMPGFGPNPDNVFLPKPFSLSTLAQQLHALLNPTEGRPQDGADGPDRR